MLSIVAEPTGDVVYVHADLEGLEVLERAVAALRSSVAQGKCEHDHLFTEAYGGAALSETMLGQERTAGCTQVHHLKLYGWTGEWSEKHGLVRHAL